LQERARNGIADADALKKNAALAEQEWEEKKREQKTFRANPAAYQIADRKKFSIKQQGELLDAEEQLLGYKKSLQMLRSSKQILKGSILSSRLKLPSLFSSSLKKKKNMCSRS